MKCKLCQNSDDLIDSHIIPEFLYKPVYDDKHRAKYLGIRGTRKEDKFIQKGIREKLLCADCDNKLIGSKIERPASNLFKDIIWKANPKQHGVILNNLNYRTLKQFHIINLFRANFSKLKEYNQVSLGEKHEKGIRDLLMENNVIDGSLYNFFGYYITFNGKIVADLIMEPLKRKDNAHTVYVWIFGGIAWHIYVSSHKTTNEDICLQKSGTMLLPFKELTDVPYLQDFAKRYFN